MNPTESLWKCPKRVGFLFPHPCERLTPNGCPDCNNGTIDDPYRRTARAGYNDNDYDNYSSDETAGWSAYGGGQAGGAGASMDFTGDFTEADGESLTDTDRAFEDDLSAS